MSSRFCVCSSIRYRSMPCSHICRSKGRSMESGRQGSRIPPSPESCRADGPEIRILVVDDNRELCHLVQNICGQEGFSQVETAFSGREAEKRIGDRKVDFLILDVNMPLEDGFSFFQRMKPVLESQRIPVLFLSARDQDEDRLLGLGLGADDYMTKPFLPKELLLRISAILRRTYRLEEQSLPCI